MFMFYRTFRMCIEYLQEDKEHSIICALCRISVLQNTHWQTQVYNLGAKMCWSGLKHS